MSWSLRAGRAGGKSDASQGYARRRNPFYGALVLLSFFFLISSIAYLMTDTALNPALHADHPLVRWMAAYGDRLILGQVGGIVALALAAMALDACRWRGLRRVRRKRTEAGR